MEGPRWTLDDYIISLFKAQKTETPEFKAMRRIFGDDKIEKIWHKYLELKHNSINVRTSNPEVKAETQQSTPTTQSTQFEKAGSFASRSLPKDDW